MTQRDQEAGILTEVAGAAALVQPFAPDDLESLDLLFFCEPRESELGVLDRLPASLDVIVVSPTVAIPNGHPVVAGDGEEVARGEVLVSPHAAVVGLAHLLRPLAALGLEEAVATLLLPISIYDQEALEEVFAQTRALLEFKRPAAGKRFSQQLTFNILPGPPDEAVIVEQLGALLPGSPRIAVHSLQAGVFHGLSPERLLSARRRRRGRRRHRGAVRPRRDRAGGIARDGGAGGGGRRRDDPGRRGEERRRAPGGLLVVGRARQSDARRRHQRDRDRELALLSETSLTTATSLLRLADAAPRQVVLDVEQTVRSGALQQREQRGHLVHLFELLGHEVVEEAQGERVHSGRAPASPGR